MRALAALAAAAALAWSLLTAASCISAARQDIRQIRTPKAATRPP